MELLIVVAWCLFAFLWMATKDTGGTTHTAESYWREIDNRRDPWA